MRARLVAPAITLLSGLLVGGCDAPSQLVLGFATDLSAPNVIDRVQMHVLDQTGNELLEQQWILPGIRLRDFKLPGSYTLYAGDGAEPAVRVVLDGLLGDDPKPVVERSAAVQFSSQNTLFFRMTLVQRCMGMVCAEGQSCIEGACRTETVNTVSLRDYHSGREAAVECDSGSHLIDTSTQEPMETDGSGQCAADQWCGESTCYRDQGQGLLWCTNEASTCDGIDTYEGCIVDHCETELATCFGADWHRGRFDGPCRDYALCRTACDCDVACIASCDLERAPACAACLDGEGGVTSCRAGAGGACAEPVCRPAGRPDDFGTLPDLAAPADAAVPIDMTMKAMIMKPFIAAGTYTLGCGFGDLGTQCNPDAMPLHQVQVGAYFIDATEVTQGEYDACVQASMCTAPTSMSYTPATTPMLPVAGVLHAQAATFCAYRGMAIGASMGRLPTEAEWEIAAHGVAGSLVEGAIYPWGNVDPIDCTRALFNVCEMPGPQAVGTHPTGATALGVQDLAGNVAEWVSDWYDPEIYMLEQSMGTVTNPTGGDGSSNVKVVRGGGYQSSATELHAAARQSADPTMASDAIGFRCVYIP